MPRLNEMPRLVLLLVCGLSRAVWAGNPVTGEICADRRATETCAATQDVVLVVDNSGSVSDLFDGINEFLSRFVDRYELDANSVLSPRIGIVTFDSAFDSSKSDSARVLFPLTNNAAKLQWAISTRPGPHHNRVWTCISCGIDKSTELFSWFPRDEAMPLIIVLTDGEQRASMGATRRPSTRPTTSRRTAWMSSRCHWARPTRTRWTPWHLCPLPHIRARPRPWTSSSVRRMTWSPFCARRACTPAA